MPRSSEYSSQPLGNPPTLYRRAQAEFSQYPKLDFRVGDILGTYTEAKNDEAGLGEYKLTKRWITRKMHVIEVLSVSQYNDEKVIVSHSTFNPETRRLTVVSGWGKDVGVGIKYDGDPHKVIKDVPIDKSNPLGHYLPKSYDRGHLQYQKIIMIGND